MIEIPSKFAGEPPINPESRRKKGMKTWRGAEGLNEQRKREQAEKGYDSLRYFVFTTIQEKGVGNAEAVSAKIAQAFVDHPNWRHSEAALRELRKAVTFAVFAEVDGLDEVAAVVETLLAKLLKSTG